jgi:hypothetical protein
LGTDKKNHIPGQSSFHGSFSKDPA